MNRALRGDLLISACLVLFTLAYAAYGVAFDIPPFEDAAMLMRYADHLGRGYGMVWNIGEAPVDGATDFLFTVASGGLVGLSVPVSRSVRGLGFAAHLITVVLIYLANRRLWGSGVMPAVFSALYLSVGTGLSYVAAYFGTPFFALAASLSWVLALLLMDHEAQSVRLSSAFALSSLTMALIRPEGAILAILMLAAIVAFRGARRSATIALAFVALFGVLGLVYFLWRWDYFGYPLPNPFYRKGSGLYWDSLSNSLSNSLRLSLPFVLAFVLGFAHRGTARKTMAILLPIVGFSVAFVLVSDETNFGARFQYALLPIVLLSWLPLARWATGTLSLPGDRRPRLAIMVAVIAAGAMLVYYSWLQNCFFTSYQRTCAVPYVADGRFDLGRLLSEHRGRGYAIATTEAGLLPYYSGWTAVDTWGLNDQWIAHHGGVTAEYLDRYHPHVIAFHAYFSPLVPPRLTEANLAQDWFRMTITLKEYAETRGYILAAVFGDSPYDTHYYYVRPDFADSQRIVRQISTMPRYYWFATGKKSINYASFGLE